MTRVQCQVYQAEGYLQKINDRLYLVRHYEQFKDGKSPNTYHRQSLDYLKSLGLTPNNDTVQAPTGMNPQSRHSH